MGLAKEKLFGTRKKTRLERFVERGTLLEIDLAYARMQSPNGDEEELATHAALLMLLRQGHTRLAKESITDQELASLVQEGASLPKYAHFENQTVHHIGRLLSFPPQEGVATVNPQATDEQNQAIQNALRYPISLITGGPGTGKTFTASQIVQALDTKTLLTAPTGKAAAHLESKVDLPVEAATLHSLLGVRSPLDYTKEVLPLNADLVIVDECSMIDPPLFSRLLSAIGPRTSLVLMGDVNQLPAVEGGSVFADLIASKVIPMTTLTKCMRSDRTEILDVAQSILEGKAQDLRNIDLGFSTGDIETIYAKLWEHSKAQDFSKFRILSTLRKGPIGVDALNAFFFEKFSQNTDEFPIMIRRNDSRTGLCNGDTGLLIKGKEARFSDGRIFLVEELPPYDYAYCISVHKSQGSEYDHVLLLVPDGSEAFGKEVLYTAVTRAKTTLEIDGNPTQITAALQRSSGKISGIRDRLSSNATRNR